MLLHREYSYLHWLWVALIIVVGTSLVIMLWHPRASAFALATWLGARSSCPRSTRPPCWQVPVDGTFPAAGPYIPDNIDTQSFGIPPDDVQSYRTLIAYVRPTRPTVAGTC